MIYYNMVVIYLKQGNKLRIIIIVTYQRFSPIVRKDSDAY